jgi:RNA polymerase sigma-70 factor (ECF subfamily)
MHKKEFAKFYEENVQRIYRYVFFRVGRNVSVSEDLVSEIFMKALEHFEKYDPAVSKSAWIYRNAHNHLANYFRDSKPSVDIDDVMFSLEGERGPETMEKRADALQLYEMLDRLSPEDRRLVTMKYLEGYSYQQMGEIMGRSADSLKVATHRVMQKLRGSMKS